jgi:hypothetical protein
MKSIITCLCLFISYLAIGQVVVINEIDADTPGIDDKEFVELKSEQANFPLDGYVLVFFNGSTSGMNSSYFTLDLDTYVTDVNGLLVIGSNTVSPVPQLLIEANVIQNGADAVALYQADSLDFPDRTTATIENLVDVIIYGTSDADDLDLIDIFNDDPNFTNIQQINEGSGNNTNSIQRFDDNGVITYMSTVPTPRRLNDGSGIPFNGVAIDVATSQVGEDGSFTISLNADEAPITDLNFNISLSNQGFNSNDYTGDTSISIPAGFATATTTITLIDDLDDEGDEVCVISFDSLPDGFLALNDKIEVRIVDNDFQIAPYGVPTNPTFTFVTSTAPNDYYFSLDGNAGDELKQAIQNIIADSTIVRTQTYADIVDILNQADQNPANSNEVWLMYSEIGRAKLDFQTTSNSSGKWNREHTYPRSRGDFGGREGDDVADGIDVFWITNADSLRHGNSDAHALRATDAGENSSRGNKHYGEYTGPAGTQGSFYGDVARSVLYMELRFNGLQVVDGFPDIDGQLGDLATLLEWHRNDPPDDFEMNRNNVVYEWQKNRNPLIDIPELVELIWGDRIGEPYFLPLSTSNENTLQVTVHPNPATNQLFINDLEKEAQVHIFSLDGKQMTSLVTRGNQAIPLNLKTGMYILKIISDGKQAIKKINIH